MAYTNRRWRLAKAPISITAIPGNAYQTLLTEDTNEKRVHSEALGYLSEEK